MEIRSVITNCNNCKKEIKVPKSSVNRSKSGHVYCSKSCAVTKNNTLFKNGINHPNYTTGSASYRNRKLKESKGECENCGINISCLLEVHHKDENRKNNNIDNLELLCANCHLLKHYKFLKTVS